MTITDTATSTTVPPVAVPPVADHTISTATAAAELGVQESTVLRYLRAGRLARLGGGVSADSVQAYTATRDANVARTRFRPAAAYPAYVADGPVEAACALYAASADLARQGDRGKRKARKVLDVVEDGVYGPWQVERVASGKDGVDLVKVAEIFAYFGLDVPTKPHADTLKVTHAA